MIDIYIENIRHGYLISSIYTDDLGNEHRIYFQEGTLENARFRAHLLGKATHETYRVIEHIRPLQIPHSIMAKKKTKKTVKKTTKKKVVAKKK